MAETSQVERIPDIGDEPELLDPLTNEFFQHSHHEWESEISLDFLNYLKNIPTNLNNLAQIHRFLINKLRLSREYTFWITVLIKFKSYLKNHRLDGSKISWYDFTPSLSHKFFVDTITKTGRSLYYHLVAKKMILKYDDYHTIHKTSRIRDDYEFDHRVYQQTDTQANGGKNYISKSRKNKNKKKRKSRKQRKSKTRRKSRKHR